MWRDRDLDIWKGRTERTPVNTTFDACLVRGTVRTISTIGLEAMAVNL